MFFDANTRTEYEMLFKQAAKSLSSSYGVNKPEGLMCSEKPMKKDDKDEAKSTKH